MKKVLATLALAALVLPFTASPSFADWNHDHGRGYAQPYRGGGRDGGHWWHGNHGGRPGWWWVYGNRYSYYPAPVYPYPYYNYPAPPVVVAPPPTPYGYYPYSSYYP